MTWDAVEAWWWPYLFILVAGWFATDIWRFIGVFLGGRIDESSDLLVLVRCIATALVAAVIANMVLFPAGAAADIPMWVRVGALATGFAAYLFVRRNMLVAILASQAFLIPGLVLYAP